MYIDANRFRHAANRVRGKSLDSIHLSIRVSTSPIAIANLLDEYIVLAASRASAGLADGAKVVGGMVPGGAVVSAAVSSVGNLAGSGGGAAGASYGATG